MPSTLSASRDFMARALARVRSGVSEAERRPGREGPDLKVEPFDSRNVSTPAGFIKLAASINAGRRAQANYRAAEAERDLARDLMRERIATVRAQGKYYLGEGRQGGVQPRVLSMDVGPYKAGTPIADVGVDIRNRGLQATADRERASGERIGRVSAANSGLGELDKRIGREAEGLATSSFAEFAPTFDLASKGDETALRSLEVDPKDYADAYGTQKSTILDNARKRILGDLVRLHTQDLEKRYGPERSRYQSVIDQGAEGFGGTGDQGSFDENDPLGLGIGPDEE